MRVSTVTHFLITPLASQVLSYMEEHGSISALDAFRAFQIPSGSLTRRITEIMDAGVPMRKETKRDPVSKRRYTRYFLGR